MNETDLEVRLIRVSIPVLLNIGLWIDMVIAMAINSKALLSIGLIGFGSITYPLCYLINQKYGLGLKWVIYTVMSVFVSLVILSILYYILVVR